MVISKRIMTPAGVVSYMLGIMALWLGFVAVPTYAVGFAILLPSLQAGRAAAQGLVLPPVIPLIGLTLAGLGWLIARTGRRQETGLCLAALALNAIPMTLAIALMLLGAR